jgi:peptidoglycan/LPS O-acetylase OafA/YrhL
MRIEINAFQRPVTPKYRPDIDGLRAIAVLAVLLFHAEVPGFTGGFVGVDVFFVISGYLITSIIVKDLQSDSFSIARFYERRIRRIFPALFSMLAFVLVAGACLLDQNAFRELGKNIWATTLFSANILYWQQAGYFESSSLLKPLLHTWSLAVEEQYYIFFPLLLLLTARYLKGNYAIWIIGAFVLSLGASIYEVTGNPVAAFYLMPDRAWELLTGSIIAIGILPVVQVKWQKNLLALAGVVFIAYSIVFYNNTTPFPGVSALIPVFGTAFVIYSGIDEGTYPVRRILSARPLVFIGLISYSLYLWHWPFAAFARYVISRPFETHEKLALVFSSIAVAILSWKFIEQPFRGKHQWFPERKRLFSVTVILIVSASCIGGMIDWQNGMKWRFPEANAGMEQGAWKWYPSSPEYGILEQPSEHIQPGRCGAGNVPGTFLLWGDSHAMALIPGIDSGAGKHGVSGYILTHSQCPPLLDFDVLSTEFDESLFNSNVLRFIAGKPGIRTVILAAAWHSYWYLHEKTFENQLGRTIDELLKLNKKVVLVCDIPYLGNYESPRPVYLSRRFPDLYKLDEMVWIPDRASYDDFNKGVNTVIRKISVSGKSVDVIHPESLLFDRNMKVVIMDKDLPLYRNESHLSTHGSEYIAPAFDKLFSSLAVNNSHGLKDTGQAGR